MGMSEITVQKEASLQELSRLFQWIRENTDDWWRLCNPDGYRSHVGLVRDLAQRLCKANLYSMALLAVYSNHLENGVDRAIDRTVSQSLFDTPPRRVMERLLENLCEAEAEEEVRQKERERERDEEES